MLGLDASCSAQILDFYFASFSFYLKIKKLFLCNLNTDIMCTTLI